MRNAASYRSLAALLIVGLAVTSVAQGASLQFIVFCDTIDANIGTDHDLALCSTWAQSIATQTGLDLRLQTLSGTAFTPTAARNLLNAFTPAADDVVFFVYSGHGANSGTSPWPMFTILTDLHDPVAFDEVVAILQPKSQRALFVMSDCCNVPPETPARTSPPVEFSGMPALATANYQHLFLDFRGTILATSSTVGQYSLSDPMMNGGLFLYTLVNDVNSLAANVSNLTWDQVMSTTSSDAHRNAEAWITGSQDNIQPQQAYYTIDGEQVAPSIPAQPTTSDTVPEQVADDTPATSAPAVGNCGAMGAASMLATALGCFALKSRRKVNLP